MCTSILFTQEAKRVTNVRGLVAAIGAEAIRFRPELDTDDIRAILAKPDQCLCSVDIDETARAAGVEIGPDHDGDPMRFLWPGRERR